ncbi:hypothetical protein TNCV_2365401 [Trichonephila clavipes]|nr:hypothetical protein TNCV_2365401 [Trichonephila clavipes]
MKVTPFNGNECLFHQDSIPTDKAKTIQWKLKVKAPDLIEHEGWLSSCPNLNPVNSKLWSVLERKGLVSNFGEGMDVCKYLVPVRHGGTLNIRRAENPLERLVEREEGQGTPRSPLGDFPSKSGGTELKHTIACIVL